MYYLKYKLDPDTLTSGHSPHLETDTSADKSEESVRTLNTLNYQQALKTHAYTLVEVYSKKCPGCRRIDPLMPKLQSRLKDTKGGELVRMDVLNEVSFLKNVDKTPSFLVYSRKRGTFTPLSKVDG